MSKKLNPITKITCDVIKYGWNLFKPQKITKADYHFLHCSKGVIPRFYDLPKVHKVTVHLCLIVSFFDLPTYNLSKFFSRLLSRLLVNRYSVCNSKKFVDYVKNFTIFENAILVSYDVVSWFTSVLVSKVLGLVLDVLPSDKSLASRTSLDIPDIALGLWTLFFFDCIFLQKLFFSNKSMALLWAFASLLSLLLLTWNILATQLSQHFTPRRHFD